MNGGQFIYIFFLVLLSYGVLATVLVTLFCKTGGKNIQKRVFKHKNRNIQPLFNKKKGGFPFS